MQKLLLILLLAAFVGGTAAPFVSSVLGFGPAIAYAGNNDDQGDDNDDQGEDEQ